MENTREYERFARGFFNYYYNAYGAQLAEMIQDPETLAGMIEQYSDHASHKLESLVNDEDFFRNVATAVYLAARA